MRQPDDPDVPARTDGTERLVHGVLRAHRLDDAVRAEPVGQLADPLHALVAPLRDDLRRAERARELLARRVPAHRDHLLGAELRGGEDRE